MALKASVYGFIGNYSGPGDTHNEPAVGVYGWVFDGSAIIRDGDNVLEIVAYIEPATVSMTVQNTRASLQAAFKAEFATRTGRVDGGNMTFNWFDNAGLLNL